jgi:hypothetical protein
LFGGCLDVADRAAGGAAVLWAVRTAGSGPRGQRCSGAEWTTMGGGGASAQRSEDPGGLGVLRW